MDSFGMDRFGMDRFGMDRFGMDKFSPVSGRPAPVRLLPALACALSTLLAASTAAACDGKSYSFSIAAGAVVSAGGLSVRLDKAKFLDDIPDKYYISVKDDGELLADHTLLIQRDTVNLKTKCGIVSIGADRKSMFSNGTLALNWSYF